MGFGLHSGWAIEGAIGSSYKIDASYLSPNVNIASRLDGATKFFGVPLLFSGVLYDMLTPETQRECRLLDIITVKGSIRPLELYTVDIHIPELDHHGSKIDKFDKSKLNDAQINRRRFL
jgi:class 3 adenylate cyclase